MPTLVAIGYAGEGTAAQARDTVSRLESDLVIQADGVAAISRDQEGRYHVLTSHGAGGTAGGAIWGGFWDKEFQQQVRDHLQPGTSALFMVIEHVTPDKAIAALQQHGGTVIKTSLSDEDAKKLQAALQPPASVGADS